MRLSKVYWLFYLIVISALDIQASGTLQIDETVIKIMAFQDKNSSDCWIIVSTIFFTCKLCNENIENVCFY